MTARRPAALAGASVLLLLQASVPPRYCAPPPVLPPGVVARELIPPLRPPRATRRSVSAFCCCVLRSGSRITRVGEALKKNIEHGFRKGGKRDWWQARTPLPFPAPVAVVPWHAQHHACRLCSGDSLAMDPSSFDAAGCV